MAVNLHDRQVVLRCLVQERFKPCRRPCDALRRADFAFAVRDGHNFADDECVARRPLSAATQCNSNSLTAITRKEMSFKELVLGLGQAECRAHYAAIFCNSRASHEFT